MDSSHQRTAVTEKYLKELSNIRKYAVKQGLETKLIRHVFLKNVDNPKKCRFWVLKSWSFWLAILAVTVGGVLYCTDEIILKLSEYQCIIDNNFIVMEMTRPLQECGNCKDLSEVPVEFEISKKDFVSKYAYTTVPVLIKGATKNWTAMENFSYTFFKQLYTETEGALKSVEDECQFFPYGTEFITLEKAFNMSNDRANFDAGEKPWYFGWSNCHDKIQEILRKHYQRPYFLPDDSESSSLDWIFMGGSGKGAHMHIDYVQKPSWQAQVSGKKTWQLIPSYECENICRSMNVTVEKGDIIVLDTNIWFHSTFIHPGEISITIGSEYD